MKKLRKVTFLLSIGLTFGCFYSKDSYPSFDRGCASYNYFQYFNDTTYAITGFYRAHKSDSVYPKLYSNGVKKIHRPVECNLSCLSFPEKTHFTFLGRIVVFKNELKSLDFVLTNFEIGYSTSLYFLHTPYKVMDKKALYFTPNCWENDTIYNIIYPILFDLTESKLNEHIAKNNIKPLADTSFAYFEFHGVLLDTAAATHKNGSTQVP